MDSEALEDYFIRASLKHFLKTRHPYDFIETYEILRHVFAYQAHYVNLGYWRDGFETKEAGRLLTDVAVAFLNLQPGDSIIDVGSGLGQAAVDTCRVHDLSRVLGINVNHRQVRFANMLAARENLADKVVHVAGDACQDLHRLEHQGYTSILALECANHFSDPASFFKAARKVIGPEGTIALSINVSGHSPSLKQQWLTKAAFGFSPAPVTKWVELLADARFDNINVLDISDFVLKRGLKFALLRLEQTHSTLKCSALHKMYVKLQLKTAVKSAESGSLQYYIVSANGGSEKPGRTSIDS